MYKKFNIIIFSLTGLCLLFLGIINVIIDPYYQYHMPFFDMKPVVDNERYQNPGMAENFEYDSVLMGSSMTQNFRVSEFNEQFNSNTIKLTYSAIRTGSFHDILEKAFATHDVKNVFIGLDLDPLLDTPGNYYFPIPEYLYDENIFNDVNYLLNKSVFDASFNQVVKNIKNEVEDINDAYMWSEDVEYSTQPAMNSVYWDMYTQAEEKEYPEFIENAKINLNDNIIKFIKENPDTQFYIFYPPYSLLWWNHCLNIGNTSSMLDLLHYTSSQLLEYDNVKLYGFQNITELVTDLRYYTDYNHYIPKINSQMVKWMKNDDYLLTKENVIKYEEDLENLVRNFEYSQFESFRPN